MISESPNTFMCVTFKSNSFLNPCSSALYSTVLLVHSNSSLKDIMVLLPCGSRRMQPYPNPSCDLEPSKCSDQMLVLSEVCTYELEGLASKLDSILSELELSTPKLV